MQKVCSHDESIYRNKKQSSGSGKPVSAVQPHQYGSTDFKKFKKHTNDPKTSGKFRKKMRRVSINSYKPEFISKKLISKTKEIYGINRVAIFNRDCTLKSCIEKLI